MSVENLTPDEELIHRLGGQIKRLQEQLCIATKALREYADPQIWEMDGFCYKDRCVAEQALKEIDLVGTSVSLATEEV